MGLSWGIYRGYNGLMEKKLKLLLMTTSRRRPIAQNPEPSVARSQGAKTPKWVLDRVPGPVGATGEDTVIDDAMNVADRGRVETSSQVIHDLDRRVVGDLRQVQTHSRMPVDGMSTRGPDGPGADPRVFVHVNGGVVVDCVPLIPKP